MSKKSQHAVPNEDGWGVMSSGAEPIEDTIARIAGEVSSEEWAKTPADLSIRLDHYLYGTEDGQG